ncbi:hypothetical protein SKAU_G00088270 [Synaphobranchus kaupii]|uniref:Uncharacterized protein n=1 Tax=Synaphobranchus kaupii TaxID=118154 RepID=A0A9Q1FVV5_SYNKA|nr:hypothetical protein SKAU_G00088270 [Synaphobranchus kaupii]
MGTWDVQRACFPRIPERSLNHREPASPGTQGRAHINLRAGDLIARAEDRRDEQGGSSQMASPLRNPLNRRKESANAEPTGARKVTQAAWRTARCLSATLHSRQDPALYRPCRRTSLLIVYETEESSEDRAPPIGREHLRAPDCALQSPRLHGPLHNDGP